MTSRTAGVSAGEMLWRPPADVVQSSRVGQFCSWLAEHRGVEAFDHDTLWRWSVDDLDGFWSAISEYFGVTDHGARSAVLPARVMPGTRWFPGSLLNYVEDALRGAGAPDDQVAVFACSQSRPDADLTWGELRRQVARARQVLVTAACDPATGWPATRPTLPRHLSRSWPRPVWVRCGRLARSSSGRAA